jgi:CubicO group peptidase (beta-lactamase class C family)
MHLPGIGRDGFRRDAGDDPIEIRAFAERWCSADLGWEPGSRWGYSNSGYFLLGAIVEAATGTSYEEALGRLVLEPAGMHDTGDLAARPGRVVPGLAQGYERSLGALVTRRPWNLSTAFGAGAMYSTVGDLERFDQVLDREGFLSPAAREAMFTPGVGGYGCGWEIRDMPIGPDRAPRRVATHEGFIFWAMARIYRVPEEHAFVALLNNTGDAPLDSMFVRLADVLHGRAVVWPRPSAAEAIHALAVERGGQAAVARYRELAAREGDRYEFTERGLNQLGYRLMGEGRSEAAVAIFALMTESYPASANAFDSLGEGLAAVGRRDEAIAAYRRSLELDPANRNAADRIEKLRSGPTQPAPLR